MSTPANAPQQHLAPVGEVLRHWRRVRRISQMDAAHMAQVSPRHLSFVENGHARASRDLLRRLGRTLDMPLRDRNLWLRSLGGGVFAALRGGLVAAITQDWLQVGVAV